MIKLWDNFSRSLRKIKPLCSAQTVITLFSLAAINYNVVAEPVSKTADEPPQFYQIELIVFSNLDPAVSDVELWPQDIQLQYPQPLVIIGGDKNLQTSDSAATPTGDNKFQFSLKESTDRFAIPDFQLDTSDTAAAQNQDPSNANPMVATPGGSTPGTAEHAHLINVDGTYYRIPSSFTPLAADQRLLESEAGHLRRSRYKHILTHLAWIQNMPSDAPATNVLITGGDQFDQHFELEGSISLWRERYLHIATNLWFNHFILNVGQEPGEWPLLPPLPSQQNLALDSKLVSSSMLGFGNQLQSFIENQYIVDRIVLMQQRRRMRSSELHYLDHPLFGLLIEITPVELEVVVPTDEKGPDAAPADTSTPINPVPTDVSTLLDQPLAPGNAKSKKP